MIIEGKLTVKAPIRELWDMLLDPETLGSCLPGAEKVERIDEKTYDSVVKQKVGQIKVTLKFRNVLTDMQPPHRLVMEGEGEDITKLGHMKQKTIVELCDIGDGNVDVSYKSDVDRRQASHVRGPGHEEQGQGSGKGVYAKPSGKTQRDGVRRRHFLSRRLQNPD